MERAEREVASNDQGPAAERTNSRAVFSPATDILETAHDVVVIADMPGVDERSVDITLEDNRLTIVGRTSAEQPQGFERSYAEYESGDSKRVFTLSERIDRDGIQATVQQGVLRVRLPKAEPNARKISVTAASFGWRSCVGELIRFNVRRVPRPPLGAEARTTVC